MVSNATSLGRSGLHDWLIQRVSSIVIAAYIFCLTGIFIRYHGALDFGTWQLIFSHLTMQVFTTLFLLSLIAHAWVGIWTITTDYLKNTAVRLLVQIFVIIALLACFFWGIQILWGG